MKYLRPAGWHRTEIEILKSRFITTVQRATTPEAARSFIQEVRYEMPDASHHVYAFRAGYGNSVIEGMSDDGEPAGTSGPPTLAVVRGSDIGDIVLVTTRYFGGTKLGTGGLVRAYTEAAQEALTSLPLDEKAPRVQVGIDLPYRDFEKVKRLIDEHDGAIDHESFAGEVSLIVTFLKETFVPFRDALVDLSAGQLDTVLLKTTDDD